jgi:hypothetical protein
MKKDPAGWRYLRRTFTVLTAAVLASCAPAEKDRRAEPTGSVRPLITPKPKRFVKQVVFGSGKRGLGPKVCSDVEAVTGNMTGQTLSSSTSDDAAPGISMWTKDVTIASDQSLFVADALDNRIVHLDADGKVIGWWGHNGRGPGEFTRIGAIALGAEGNVYASDNGGRINVFAPDGRSLRTFQVSEFQTITDIATLTNGNLVVAQIVEFPAVQTPYVRIVNDSGKAIHTVLSVDTDRSGGVRPLMLGMNEVRVTSGPEGLFAVWYPIDNYVEVFDTSGTYVAQIEGCLPNEIRNLYAAQFTGGAGFQSFVKLTFGVRFINAQTIAILSGYNRPEGGRTMRMRTYSFEAVELTAVDARLPRLPGGNSQFEFLSDTLLIGFDSDLPERGIRRYRISRQPNHK